MAFDTRCPPVKSGSRGSNKYGFAGSHFCLTEGGFLSETDKVQYRKIALGKRKELHANITHKEYGPNIRHFFRKWILREKAVSVIGFYYTGNTEKTTLTLI